MENLIIVSSEEKLRQIVKDTVMDAILNTEKPSKFISRREAAANRGISLPTLDRAIERGEVKVVRMGKRVLVRED